MNQKLRRAVVNRSQGRCESCGTTVAGQIDHFFGRARAEGVESCWWLCIDCHFRKTNNRPSSRYWMETFIEHCKRHGYSDAIERARKRLEGIIVVRESFTMVRPRGVQ